MCATWEPTKIQPARSLHHLQASSFFRQNLTGLSSVPSDTSHLNKVQIIVETENNSDHENPSLSHCKIQTKMCQLKTLQFVKNLTSPYEIYQNSQSKKEIQKNLPDILMLRVSNNQLSRHNRTKMHVICQNVISVSSSHKAFRWSSQHHKINHHCPACCSVPGFPIFFLFSFGLKSFETDLKNILSCSSPLNKIQGKI